MIPLQFEPTSQTGSIALDVEDFAALCDYEGYRGPRKSMILSDILEKIAGVSRVDYSGHYGAYVHLTLDLDEPAALDKVRLAINEHLPLCRAWWRSVASAYLVDDADLDTGALRINVSPSDLFEAKDSALHNGFVKGQAVYAVGEVTPGVWMIRTDDLRD